MQDKQTRQGMGKMMRTGKASTGIVGVSNVCAGGPFNAIILPFRLQSF